MGVICQKWDYLIIRHKTHPKEKHRPYFPRNESLLKTNPGSWYELWILVYCSSSHYKLSSHSDWWKVEWGKVLSEPSIIQRGALQILSSCLRQGYVKLAKRLPMHGLLSVNLKLHELHFKYIDTHSSDQTQCIMTSEFPPDRRWPDQIFISSLLVHQGVHHHAANPLRAQC